MLIVQKYGGSSVADREKVFNAADIISAEYKAGNQVVVVVSAQGDCTDDLLDTADLFNPDANKRELDMLLSTGEQQSAALMSMVLNLKGHSAISLNAWQVGIFTTNDYGNARIISIDCERIQSELSKGNIVVVAGFQGINEYGDITTLGRGGSDTTAVALASALGADKCEIYTDVEGVFTADPRIVEEAYKLDNISYDEMLNYTTMGAKVLHNRSVELGKTSGTKIFVRSSFSKDSGTAVENISESVQKCISGIASDKETLLIKVKGKSSDVFSAMEEYNIPVDMLNLNLPEEMTFTISYDNLRSVIAALKEFDKTIEEYSKISIIGTGVQSNPAILQNIVRVLTENNILYASVSMSETKISLLVKREDNDNAMKVLHKNIIDRKAVVPD